MTKYGMNDPMNGHEFDGPDEFVGRIDALMEMAAIPAEECRHCRATGELVPGAGSQWLIGITHAQDCPDYID